METFCNARYLGQKKHLQENATRARWLLWSTNFTLSLSLRGSGYAGAEAAYCALEDDLQHYLDTYESTHDYDEYHFDLDEIEHDPYVLLSLCVRSMRDNGQ